MCGFVGMLAPSAPPDQDAMRRLGGMLAHRGPDDSGEYLEPEAGLGLAHRRLAILDVSPLGHQPMASASGRYVIAYNGEIYNHLELRDLLVRAGARDAFRGESDTETLLAAIEYWGFERALKKLDGMFAFALWDRQTRRLYLARDRMGEKPLYVGWLGGALVCASELKPILAAFPTETDEEAMGLMLGLGYVPAPRSIIRGVFKLPPAHYVCLDVTDAARSFGLDVFMARVRRYWTLLQGAAGDSAPFDAQEQIERFDHLLKDTVRTRMLSDVPLGACLSGGIDSSLIVAAMQSQSMRAVKTFTVGFEEAAYDESPHAREIAEHLGTEHTEIMLPASQTLDLIPRLPRIYDEPFGDSSQLPMLLLSQALRKHVTVALSGDGGDELLYGYARYPLARRLWPLYGWAPGGFRRFVARRSAKSAQRNFRLWRLAQRLSAPDFDAFYLSVLAPLPDPGLFWRDAPPLWSNLPPLPASVRDADARMMLRDQALYLPDDVLVKVDRASMAVGLEMRAPLLGHRLVEFAWSVPMTAKYHDGQGKWLMRQVLQRYVPPSLFDRPKQGFGIPIDGWLRGPLREWAQDLLSPQSLSACPRLRAEAVLRTWQSHCAGKINAGYVLWNALMLLAWLREWRR